jgi:hypothetical protein
MKRQRTEDFMGGKHILYDTIAVDTWHCTFSQAYKIYNNNNELDVNYEL